MAGVKCPLCGGILENDEALRKHMKRCAEIIKDIYGDPD